MLVRPIGLTADRPRLKSMTWDLEKVRRQSRPLRQFSLKINNLESPKKDGPSIGSRCQGAA